METLKIMGVEYHKLQVSQSLIDKKCEYLDDGICKSCSCDRCIGGSLVTHNSNGTLSSRQCDCMKKAYNRHILDIAGLSELAKQCTFDKFAVEEAWQKIMLQKAKDYLEEWKLNSFFISGQSGCGKTHLSVAIVNRIVDSGARIAFFQWVQDGTRLKSQITNNENYEREIRQYRTADLLYIDDLFKSAITDADIRLAYELLEARIVKGLPIIISSEKLLSDIAAAKDGTGEAIAGRIKEMCGKGKYCLQITGKGKNYRLK